MTASTSPIRRFPAGDAADDTAAYLAPLGRPHRLTLRLVYWFSKRQFGMVARPFSVFGARMPLAFLNFYGKVSRLDGKLRLPAETATLIRHQVAGLNGCTWCMDAARWFATTKAPGSVAKLDALSDYRSSPLFDAGERAALDFATELTASKRVSPETFAALSRHFGEREICELTWLVASEHLYNMTNVALNIHSDGLCSRAARDRS